MNKYDNYLWDLNCWYCYYGNKVIHNTCNMGIRDLPDMYAHVTPITCNTTKVYFYAGKGLSDVHECSGGL